MRVPNHEEFYELLGRGTEDVRRSSERPHLPLRLLQSRHESASATPVGNALESHQDALGNVREPVVRVGRGAGGAPVWGSTLLGDAIGRYVAIGIVGRMAYVRPPALLPPAEREPLPSEWWKKVNEATTLSEEKQSALKKISVAMMIEYALRALGKYSSGPIKRHVERLISNFLECTTSTDAFMRSLMGQAMALLVSWIRVLEDALRTGDEFPPGEYPWGTKEDDTDLTNPDRVEVLPLWIKWLKEELDTLKDIWRLHFGNSEFPTGIPRGSGV